MSGVVLWFMVSIFHSSTSGNHFARRHKSVLQICLRFTVCLGTLGTLWTTLTLLFGLSKKPSRRSTNAWRASGATNSGKPREKPYFCHCTGVLSGFKINSFHLCLYFSYSISVNDIHTHNRYRLHR